MPEEGMNRVVSGGVGYSLPVVTIPDLDSIISVSDFISLPTIKVPDWVRLNEEKWRLSAEKQRMAEIAELLSRNPSARAELQQAVATADVGCVEPAERTPGQVADSAKGYVGLPKKVEPARVVPSMPSSCYAAMLRGTV